MLRAALLPLLLGLLACCLVAARPDIASAVLVPRQDSSTSSATSASSCEASVSASGSSDSPCATGTTLTGGPSPIGPLTDALPSETLSAIGGSVSSVQSSVIGAGSSGTTSDASTASISSDTSSMSTTSSASASSTTSTADTAASAATSAAVSDAARIQPLSRALMVGFGVISAGIMGATLLL